MKRKFLPAISLVIVMALVACSSKPTTDINVTDVQNTAVAVALTGIAMTQSARPTDTPVLPTPISPTFITEAATLVPLPTLAPENPTGAPITNPNASPTPDCYQPAPLPKDLVGDQVQIKFVNKSDGPVNLSMGMYEPNDQGECYTFAFSVNKNGSEVVTILSGCYWIAGYQNGPTPSTPRVDYLCLTDTTETRGTHD